MSEMGIDMNLSAEQLDILRLLLRSSVLKNYYRERRYRGNGRKGNFLI